MCTHSCVGNEVEEFNKVLMVATMRYAERQLQQHARLDGIDDDDDEGWMALWGGGSDGRSEGVSVVEILTVENGDCFFYSISKLSGFEAQRAVLSLWMSENLDSDLGLEARQHLESCRQCRCRESRRWCRCRESRRRCWYRESRRRCR